MKVKLTFLTVIVLSVLTSRIFAGNNESDKIKQLLSLKERLLVAIDQEMQDKEEVVPEIVKCKDLSDSLNILLQDYLKTGSELNARIEAVKKKLEDIKDTEDKIYTLDAFVESREKGFAILNFNGIRIALKSNLRMGAKYKGKIKEIPGLVAYTAPGGYHTDLRSFVPFSGQTPQELKEKLEQEFSGLISGVEKNLNGLLNDALGLLRREIKRNYDAITEMHYKKALSYSDSNDPADALQEFYSVRELDENYKDVNSRIEYLKNQIAYSRAKEYLKYYDYQNAYLSFFDLAYTADFQDSKELFKDSFEKCYDKLIGTIKSDNYSIAQFAAVFDTLAIYKNKTQNDIFFGSLSDKWVLDLESFAKQYFKRKITQANYQIIPGGDIRSGYSSEKKHYPGFILVKNAVSDEMLLVYNKIQEVRMPSSGLNKESLYSVSNKCLNALAGWLGFETLTNEDEEYLDADGWENSRQRDLYFSAHSNFNFRSGEYYFKLSPENITDKAQKEDFIKRSRERRNEIDEKINTEKQYAFASGSVFAPRKIYFTPELSFTYNINNWQPSGITAQRLRVVDNIFALEAGAFLGINLFPWKEEETEKFGGFGIRGNYVSSVAYSFGNITDLKESAKFEITEFNLKGWQAELLYSKKIQIGLGLASFDYNYSYSDQINGPQAVKASASYNISSLFLELGYSSDYFGCFAKTYYSTAQEGLFSWDNKNLTGNFVLGMRLALPLKLFRIEPEY